MEDVKIRDMRLQGGVDRQRSGKKSMKINERQ